MDQFISMEDILEPFWDLPPPEEPLVTGDGFIDGVVTHGDGGGGNAMDQSPSEWSFERLLEEDLLADATPAENSSGSALLHADPVVEVDHATMAPVAVGAVGDPMEYNTILKRKLQEDLATVAMWRASSVVYPERSQVSNNYIGGNFGLIPGNRNLMQNKSSGESPINRVRNAYIRARLAACSSPREPSPSDDDDMDEVEILGFKLPTEEKVRKRKESNRESARRSRYRKAAHLKDMEDQVAHLRVENTSLLRRVAALNQKYTDATADNRVLKADMETLRAKVKMVEDVLKRVTGTSSQPSRPVPAPGEHADASGPILDSIIDYLMSTTGATADNNFMPRTTAPAPVQAEKAASRGPSNNVMINRIAAHHAVAVELLQKRLGAMPTSGVAPPESAPLGVNEPIDMDML